MTNSQLEESIVRKALSRDSALFVLLHASITLLLAVPTAITSFGQYLTQNIYYSLQLKKFARSTAPAARRQGTRQ